MHPYLIVCLYLLLDLLDKGTQELREAFNLPSWLFEEDLFDLFPKPVRSGQQETFADCFLFDLGETYILFPFANRPKKSCLIIGGEGSRSFLHADPYEWRGTYILVEGRKLWTFINPHKVVWCGVADSFPLFVVVTALLTCVVMIHHESSGARRGCIPQGKVDLLANYCHSLLQ